ncbi:hypothetical protein [Shumkonia mesophila]|uniref:hypothetical protein n=1 Tax=Shumkonia mesophila TaxID=2838854 RepID=UPI00293492A7|nr:hypothetical protein [Shumkonia mesophila]
MQTIIQETGASLMAQWRTTGGAMGAAVGEPATGDDGLQASSPITGAYCTFGDPRLTACEPSFSRMCFVEDGLKATGPTQSWPRCF